MWSPIFTGYDGKTNVQVPGFWFAVGVPECGYHLMWPVYADATVRIYGHLEIYSLKCDRFNESSEFNL